MPELHFVIPGDPATATGGYIYDRHIIAGLRARGWRVEITRLSERFPFPDRQALDEASRLLGAIPDGALVVVDGLALGAMPAVAERHAARLRLTGLVHHPLALETGLSQDQAGRLRQSEERALAAVGRVVVTSPATACALKEYGVAPRRIGVVPPGTRPHQPARGSGNQAPSLLCVAAIVPRKGHDVLLEALHQLSHRRWRLVCVGSLERSPDTVKGLRRQLRTYGLTPYVDFTGEVDEARLARLYSSADLFVLASYYEGYGMALADALAYGLPVVSTRAGAIPRTVPADAGLLVPPGSSAALADAIGRLLEDGALRQRLAAAARSAAARLPSWLDAAACFASELERVPDL